MNNQANHWEKVKKREHHGIALPISSIYSKKSSGIGEILDLIPIIQWMKQIGFDTLQLLPLSDSGSESSPYYTISSIALNPVFLSLHDLPFRKIDPPSFKTNGRIDYLTVWKEKLKWLDEYLKGAKDSLLKAGEYTKFVESTSWLLPYARFSALKKKNGGKPWWEWTDEEVYEEQLQKEYLIQFLLDQQMKRVMDEAEKGGIFLLGDGPILCNSDSVECYSKKELFMNNLTVGYPPDPFSSEGQMWGFPPYDWQAMHRDNYMLWRERLSTYEKYYSLFRLDHLIGFFRLWLIPQGKKPKEGYYMPEKEEDQFKQGTYFLKWLLDHTNMLLLGEDLGIIPAHVREIMRELGIPGTRVMRWERYWDEGGAFIPGNRYEPLSMTTLSTHDTETLAEWWGACPDEAKAFCDTFSFDYQPKISSELRYNILKASHQTASYFHVNPLQEYLSLETDWSFPNPKDERINIPGTISPFNWTFRVKPPIEEWTTRASFSDKMAKLR